MKLIIKLKEGKVIESDIPNSITIDGNLVTLLSKIKSEDLPIRNNDQIIATGSQIYSIEIVL